MIRSGSFPIKNVRLVIYENKGKTMRQVWNGLKQKPVLLLNGPFFDWGTMSATCHMKIKGRVICKPSYNSWGWAWNNGENPEWTLLPCNKENYFTNTVIINNGKKYEGTMLIWHSDSDGKPSKPRYTSRPATGEKDDKFMYYINSNCSLPGIRDVLFSSKWKNAMMGDGGGSTEAKTSEWEWYSKRPVPYYILVYLVDSEPKGEKPMVEINAYSLKEDGEKNLSTNFKVKEFACKDGSDTVLVAPRLIMILQTIRSFYKDGVIIDSGYRTPQYNAKVGGVTESQHTYGTASDIHIDGHTPEEIAKYARSLMPDWGGIGIYHKQGFVHIDVREKKADWNG